MNNISSNIKRIREQRGYTQEYMADVLEISQATYARIESQQIKLNLDRLQKVANILETDISTLLDSSKIKIQNQANNEEALNNGYVENLQIENREIIIKLVQTLENENQYLKEIEFLRAIIKP